ncbi:hypothetical protein F4604DRAFT_1686218 [Suillus subluteus]|nr:hypothetical protein F4604DRAFT_1686218 [Suillus subluteus]
MPRSKKTSSQRHRRTVLQPRFKPVRKQHRAMTAAKSTEKRAAISEALPQPIRDFRIPVSKAELSMDQWDARAPLRIHYGVPELISYGAGDTAQLEFLRVPAMKDRRILGYVPLPTRYRSSWVYLCYCVEYWLAVWKCWDGESKKNQKKQKNTKTQQERADLIDTSRKNAGARFLQAMVARRIVLEECMANGVNDERIKSLDEFLIRDHRDWLFVEFDELPDDADMYLKADPLHPGNKKMLETGWGVNMNDIPMMLGGTDDAWMSKGLDLSEMFKKDMDAALKQLKKGGEEIDIAFNENAELPDKWHESHEPPIRFISERKDKFLRDGFALDEPLIFLYRCLQAEVEIERGDFLREVMDMLANDEARDQWSFRVDQLIDGEMAWDEFSDLVSDGLNLELDRRANTNGGEPDLPFLKLDARIAVRAYLRNSKRNPDTAAEIFLRSISRFSDPGARDLKVWKWVMQKVKPNTVTTVLQQAHDHRSKSLSETRGDKRHVSPQEMENRSSMGTDGHEEATIRSDRSPEVTVTLPMIDCTNDVHKTSPVPSSVSRTTPPAKDIPSNMDMDQTEASVQDSEQQTAGHTPMLLKMRLSSSRREAWLRRHKLDKPLVFLHHCLAEEEHIEKADFVQEIMDFFPTDQERDRWSERVDHLYEGLTTWRQFSQLLAGSLELQDGRRDDGFTKGEKSESPFPTLDAKIAIRSYLRHLKEKPQDADQLFRACVDRFSTIPSSDSIWRSVQSLSQTLSSINEVLKSADAFWYNRVHSSAGKNQEDQPSTSSNAPPDYTPDTIVEFQDGMDIRPNSPSDQISQFTAAPDEDDQTTSEDDFRSESIFSLVDVERAIRSYSHDGISFNELRNILLTDIPPIHVQTVHEALRTLDPCRVDKKILNSLFKKLEEEESLAKRDVG